MNIEYIETGLLRPYEKNAKKHPEKQVDEIANSIREFGFRQPLQVRPKVRDSACFLRYGSTARRDERNRARDIRKRSATFGKGRR